MFEEERLKKVEAGELDEDEGKADPKDLLIQKSHFNFAMSKARRSVSEKDLTLFEDFAEKQKAGRGEAVTNFKFGQDENAEDGEEGDGDASADLYE